MTSRLRFAPAASLTPGSGASRSGPEFPRGRQEPANNLALPGTVPAQGSVQAGNSRCPGAGGPGGQPRALRRRRYGRWRWGALVRETVLETSSAGFTRQHATLTATPERGPEGRAVCACGRMPRGGGAEGGQARQREQVPRRRPQEAAPSSQSGARRPAFPRPCPSPRALTRLRLRPHAALPAHPWGHPLNVPCAQPGTQLPGTLRPVPRRHQGPCKYNFQN